MNSIRGNWTVVATGLLVGLTAAGCGDSRRGAVSDVIEFAVDAPYTLAPADERTYGYFRVVVLDSALDRYNEIFGYFAIDDSARANDYRELAGQLFEQVPITRVQSTEYKTAGDTLIARVIYDRPHEDIFNDRFLRLRVALDSIATPTAPQLAAFRGELLRVRKELQQVDTVIIRVVDGPRITDIATASGNRYKARADSIAAEVRKHLEQLVATSRFSDHQFRDYSNLGALAGGAISGVVQPGPIGWYQEKDVYATTEVQCEAANGSDTIMSRGYLIVSEKGKNEPDDYLCLWAGRDASDWIRVNPQQARVRMIAYHLMRDTLFGPWVKVR